jgi:hypothetical protein
MPLLSLIGGLLSAGKKPQVPDWKDVSLEAAQKEAVRANKATLPEFEDVAAEANSFNQTQLEKMLKESIPNLDDINFAAGENILSAVRGEVPDDVSALVGRRAAESAVKGGYYGSGMHRNLELRDLGLTSLQRMREGMDSASRWIASVRASQTAPMMDVTSMFISPEQQFQATFQNQEAKFNRDWMENKIAAMPDPKRAAVGQWLIKTDDAIFNTALGVAGSFAGGAMGGGGGAKAPAPPPPQNPQFSQSVSASDWSFKLY